MRRTTLRSLAGIAALTTLALTGCGTQQGLADDSPAAAGPAERTITAKRLARLRGEPTADDQGDPAAGAHFVEQHFGFHLEFCNDLAVLQCLAFVRA